MGTVSITQLANGTTADATAVDANFNNIANQLNGNIDTTNLAAGAAAANLTDASTNPSVLQDSSDRIFNYIKPGTGVLAISSGLVGTLSNITYYIAGKRYTITSIPNKTYAISQDCYVYADTTNTITYTAVTNNTASPTPPANSVLVGIMVSNGTALASINQGSMTATAPIVSSRTLIVVDTLGNPIYPINPSTSGIIGYGQNTASNFTPGTGAETDVPGMTTPVIVPTGRRIKISATANLYNPTSATPMNLLLNIKEGATYLQLGKTFMAATINPSSATTYIILSPSAGLHTYKCSVQAPAGTIAVEDGSTEIANICVELI